jgi:hypothetical protein
MASSYTKNNKTKKIKRGGTKAPSMLILGYMMPKCAQKQPKKKRKPNCSKTW